MSEIKSLELKEICNSQIKQKIETNNLNYSNSNKNNFNKLINDADSSLIEIAVSENESKIVKSKLNTNSNHDFINCQNKLALGISDISLDNSKTTFNLPDLRSEPIIILNKENDGQIKHNEPSTNNNQNKFNILSNCKQKYKCKFERNLDYYSNYIKNNKIECDNIIKDLNESIMKKTHPPIFLNVYLYNNYNLFNDQNNKLMGINPKITGNSGNENFVNNLSLDKELQYNINNTNYHPQKFLNKNMNINNNYFELHSNSFLDKISKMNIENNFLHFLFSKGSKF